MLQFTDNDTMVVHISSNLQSKKEIKDHKTKREDISIVVEGRKVKAHKAVLAASIPYFHSMFMLGMKESKMDEVDIPGIEYETMKQLIDYAYTGKMEITTDNVQSIITSAHYLQLTDLVEYCSWFLIRHMDGNNCFDIPKLFEGLALNNYLQMTIDCIRSSFLSISKQDGFIELDIDELVELLSCDQLYTDNEYDVLDRSMLWLRAKQGRQQYVERISQCVRIPSASQLIMSLLDSSMPAPPYQIAAIRRPYKQWLLTVDPNSRSSQRIQFYDPISRRYQLIKDMIMNQTEDVSSILCYKRQVIFVFRFGSSVEIFDLDTRQWTKLPNIDRILEKVNAVVVGNKLYLIGNKCDTTEMEVFDFKTQQWSRGSQLKLNRQLNRQKVAVIGKYIYMINLTPSPVHDDNRVERYDTEQDIWETVAPMVTNKEKFELTAHKGNIYVTGEVIPINGEVTRTMEVYDPDRNTWTELTTNYQPKYITSLVSTQEGIYAVAAGLHLYNVEKNEWNPVNKMVLGWGLSCAIPVSPYGK